MNRSVSIALLVLLYLGATTVIQNAAQAYVSHSATHSSSTTTADPDSLYAQNWGIPRYRRGGGAR